MENEETIQHLNNQDIFAQDDPTHSQQSSITEEFIALMDALGNTSEETDVTVQEIDIPEITEANLYEVESPDLMPVSLENNTSLRYSGASWFNEANQTSVLIAGVGGIGSHTAFAISRISPFHIALYDMDHVEEHNLSGQFYGMNDIGMHKCTAMKNHLGKLSNMYNVGIYNTAINSSINIPAVTICGFDNMEARKELFRYWDNHVSNNHFGNFVFIDGRLLAEELQIFCIHSQDAYSMERYKEYLFSDEEVETATCTLKQTTYAATMIASLITNLVINFLTNKALNMEIRPLPFLTYYNAETMLFKTEN